VIKRKSEFGEVLRWIMLDVDEMDEGAERMWVGESWRGGQ
jgi:hypothetical protein